MKQTPKTKTALKNITLSENQFKVIKDKYLRDAPSVEAWLDGVASNIALAELLHMGKEKEVFAGVDVLAQKNDVGNGEQSTMFLLHHNKFRSDERRKNFEIFMKNLYSLAVKDSECAQIYQQTKERFYQLMAHFEFLPNSPTLMNAGRPLQQLSACYVLPIEDSIEGWMDTVKNAAIIHKSGGGTGFSACRVRSRGSEVRSTKGIASGALSPFKLIDAMTQNVKQGGCRRGANMGILPYNHPDILEFIEAKRTPGVLENFNISVAITQDFMKAVEKNQDYDLIDPHTKKTTGKLNARDMWDRLVSSAWETGDPGLIMIDLINNTDSNPTPHIGQIESTNPCVTGDTFVSTEHGLLRMKELVEKYSRGGIKISTDGRVPLRVQSGNSIVLMNQATEGVTFNEISQSFCSGIKDVYLLRTNNGCELKLTEDHKVITREGFVKVKDLTDKDEILLQKGEGRFGSAEIKADIVNDFIGENGREYHHNFPKKWSRELGQVLGWLIGDGWLRKGDKNCRVGFTFGHDDKKILDYLKPILNNYYKQNIQEVKRENGVYHLSYHSKYFVDFFEMLGVKACQADEKVVPEKLFTASQDAVIGFVQGLFSSDGTVRDNPKSASQWVALTSKSKKLLLGVQILLLNLGIKSTIFNRSRKERKGLFSYINKKGEIKTYDSDGILYELGIFAGSLEKFRENIGFISASKQSRLDKITIKKAREQKFFEKVRCIEYVGKEEVYDLTEPFTHSMICNGLIVTQCGEQPLLPYEPCFAEGTLITTDKGLEKIEDLYEDQQQGREVLVATDNKVLGEKGVTLRKGIVVKTGYKKTLKVKLHNGQELRVTPNHQIYTARGWIKAEALNEHDFVHIQDGPIFENVNDIEELKKHREDLLYGWLSGDGWFLEGERPCAGICFGYDEKYAQQTLIPSFREILNCNVSSYIDKNDVIQIATEKKESIEKLKSIGFKGGKAPHKEIPSYVLTAEPSRIRTYLSALFSADGEVSTYRRRVRLSSASPKLIQQVQLLLLNFGIKSRISESKADKRVWYELAINGLSYDLFAHYIGFILSPTKHFALMARLTKNSRERIDRTCIQVKYVEESESCWVYDVHEPETHSLIAQGMVVHNCNLGSINLSKFVKEDGSDMDWGRLKECVHTCTHFLDNVIDVNNYPLPEIELLSKSNRRIGLGVMGWAETLVMLGLPYNSDKGFVKAEQVMKFINDESLAASEALAKKRGVFPNWKNSIFDLEGSYFRGKKARPRHCARTTIAPTGTIGITAGLQGAGIEPFFAIVYVRYNAKALDAIRSGEQPDEKDVFYEINPLFKKIAEENDYFGFEPKELWTMIERNHTSLEGIDEIPKHTQELFMTSHELTPEDHVRMQAAFQRHTNNAVSKTINFRNEASIEQVDHAYKLAFKLGCKGITIYRDGSKSTQVLNIAPAQPIKQEVREEDISEAVMEAVVLKTRGPQPELNKYEVMQSGKCPECTGAIKVGEGCYTCMSCGYSACSV